MTLQLNPAQIKALNARARVLLIAEGLDVNAQNLELMKRKMVGAVENRIFTPRPLAQAVRVALYAKP